MFNSINSELIGWIKTIVFAIIITLVINNIVIINAKVPTGSMENTILINDRMIAFRLSYLFSSPNRFDIIVFKNPDKLDELNVKRVIGLPGEVIEIIDGNVYVNDELLLEDSQYTKEAYTGNWGPYIVPEEKVFVLGDNRNNSVDARYWTNTFVPEEQILGRAIFKYYRNFNFLE